MKMLALAAATVALLGIGVASAQQRNAGGVARVDLPPALFPNGSFGAGPLGSVPPSAVGHYPRRHWDRRHRRGFYPGFIIVERPVPVVIERVVEVREVPAAAPPPPPPAPRKPFVLGRTYASLPGGCMKLIEDGKSYYYCGGAEWYRQMGTQYRAVARP